MTIDSVELMELLPASIARDPVAENAVRSMRGVLQDVIAGRYIPAIFSRFDSLTSEQLDHVAVMFDVSTWRDTWPIDLKKSVLRMIFQTKCRMGTLSAVREALSSLGSAVSVTEWWETTPKGTPHTFSVDATLSAVGGLLSSDLQEDLMQLLNEAKPARALYTFNLRAAEQGGMGFTGAFRPVTFRRLKNI